MSDNKATPKRIAKLLIGLFVIGLLAVGARSLRSYLDDDDARDIFTAAVIPRHDMLENIEWLDDKPGLVREVSPQAREQAAQAWIGAWEAKAMRASGEDATDLVETYFSGVIAAESETPQDPFVLRQLSHHLQINFVSADGQIIGLTATDSQSLVGHQTDASEAWEERNETYDAVLILEDGNWRVRHMVRTDIEARVMDSAAAVEGLLAGT